MPIYVPVHVNADLIYHVHIARVDESMSMDDDAVLEYSVVVHEEVGTRDSVIRQYVRDTPSFGEWLNGTLFTHRYGDGLLVCVQKALEAYNNR